MAQTSQFQMVKRKVYKNETYLLIRWALLTINKNMDKETSTHRNIKMQSLIISKLERIKQSWSVFFNKVASIF